MSDESVGSTRLRDWRLWVIIGAVVALLAAIAVVAALSGDDGSDSADGDSDGRVTDVEYTDADWPATGSLIDDADFIEEAAAELDTDTTPILLWAGTGTMGTLDISEYAAFAVPVNSPDTSHRLARLYLVGIGDDIDSPYITSGLAPLDNLVIALPLDEVEGDDHSGTWLAREDVTSVAPLDSDSDEELTIEDRFIGGGGGDGLELKTDSGVFYTDPKLDTPLPADLWDREVAAEIFGKLEFDGPWVTAIGQPSDVEFAEGTGVVAPIAEQHLGKLADGDGDGNAIRWSAFIQLPDAMVDSATSATIRAPAAADTQHPDDLADGYPYAVAVDEKRLGSRALVITPGVTTRNPRDSGNGPGTLSPAVGSARTEPDLPVMAAPSGETPARILGFDASPVVVIWYDEGGAPLWSAVVRAPEE
ncbi:hypothetical protein JL108_08055 [Aeromicrobium sp. YIM 150415]|uniref:hypothetical protein n=1 Tax=Aeromicrobium sp. YIM 150415 TaxID=2803912 RepID=UPI001966ABF8|nr:hypothetical protein [Aeromicrobium sp. YIM 150415]MBM9463400.1 hypothetical protein [Aeromicrobium sp. YIM 150415]